MGQSQCYIAQRLKFGGFLEFIAGRNNSSLPPDLLARLTERRFRQHWTRAGKRPKEAETEHPDYAKFRAIAVSEPGIMGEREYDLLTAAPEGKGGSDKTPLTGSRGCSADKSRWLRAIARSDPFIRKLFTAGLIDLKLAALFGRKTVEAGAALAAVRSVRVNGDDAAYRTLNTRRACGRLPGAMSFDRRRPPGVNPGRKAEALAALSGLVDEVLRGEHRQPGDLEFFGRVAVEIYLQHGVIQDWKLVRIPFVRR